MLSVDDASAELLTKLRVVCGSPKASLSDPLESTRRGSAKKNREFSIFTPASLSVGELRALLATTIGAPNDQIERLKMDLYSHTASIFDNPGRKSSTKKNRGHKKEKKSSKKSSNNCVFPLNNNNLSLMDLGIEDGDSVFLTNWNKISSGRRLAIFSMIIGVYHECPSLLQSIKYAALEMDNHQENLESRSILVDALIPEIATDLLEELGFVKNDNLIWTFPVHSSMKKLRLFLDVETEISRENSPLSTVQFSATSTASSTPRLDDMRTPPRSEGRRIPIGNFHMDAQDLDFKLDDGYIDMSSGFSPRLHGLFQMAGHARSAPLDDMKYTFDDSAEWRAFDLNELSLSLPQESSLDMGWDYEDAMSPSNSILGNTPRRNRRRERRRSRRERNRHLAGLEIHFADADTFEHPDANNPHVVQRRVNGGLTDLSYEQMSQLENVPVGVNASTLRLLPTQVLEAKDVEIFSRNADNDSCRICLGDYCVTEIILRLPCMHFYHKKCIEKWLVCNNKCPSCLHPVEH